MIAISYSDYLKYGCPSCGCDSASGGNVSGYGTSSGTCRECNTTFVILADGERMSSIGYGTGRKNSNGETIFEYPELQPHPRKGTPWHKWVQPDPRPEYGEYWNPRGIGYDLSGFDSSKFILRNWSFYELQQFITYKAAKYGIEVRKINPFHTSQICSCCGHWEEGAED